MNLWRRKKRKNSVAAEPKTVAEPKPKAPPVPPAPPKIGHEPYFYDDGDDGDNGDNGDNGDDDGGNSSRPQNFTRPSQPRGSVIAEKLGNSNDPTAIVNTLLNGLKCQGVSADDFCRFLGLHKNTISRWKQGSPECPHSYAFLFKRLIIDMDEGYRMREVLENIKNFRV